MTRLREKALYIFEKILQKQFIWGAMLGLFIVCLILAAYDVRADPSGNQPTIPLPTHTYTVTRSPTPTETSTPAPTHTLTTTPTATQTRTSTPTQSRTATPTSTGTSTSTPRPQPAIEVSKRLTEPVGLIFAGDTLTFRVLIRNTGQTVITYLLVRDEYSSECMSYLSADPSADEPEAGQLVWPDLTIPLGDLSPGQAVTVTLRFVAQVACQEAVNRVLVSGRDQNGNLVPDRQDRVTIVIQPTPTATSTDTLTATPTPTPTITPTATESPTLTTTPTATAPPTLTTTPTLTPTSTFTPTASPLPTDTPLPTATATETTTMTPSPGPTASTTSEPTADLASPTPSLTAMWTPTCTATPTMTATMSPSATATASPSSSATETPLPSPTGTATATPSPSSTFTEEPTETATGTVSPSPTATVTATRPPLLDVVIAISPSPIEVSVGEIFLLQIVIRSEAQPVDGVQVFLDFDPRYLAVVDARGQLTTTLQPESSFNLVSYNLVDNELGRVDYLARQTTSPFPQGSFIVASMYLMARAPVERTQLAFSMIPPRQTNVVYQFTSVLTYVSHGHITIRSGTPTPVRLIHLPLILAGASVPGRMYPAYLPLILREEMARLSLDRAWKLSLLQGRVSS